MPILLLSIVSVPAPSAITLAYVMSKGMCSLPEFNFESFDIVPDALLHLAWRNGFDHNASSHLDDMPLHYAFMKRAIDSGVEHVCGMGTMHEVGYWEGAIDENTHAIPRVYMESVRTH